jgi:predicted ArsR family transcriptional regulator
VLIRDAAALADLAALSALEDPTRRLLYELVVEAGRPVSRDQAAAEAGIGRALAAYHLERLAEHGLLDVDFARPAGRPGGPGAGRPPKRYRRSQREFVLRAPPRDYHLLAELLVLAAARDAHGHVRAALEQAAFEVGKSLGASGGSLEESLRQRGYEPIATEEGVVRLRNCPFRAVAERCPDVVCGLNLALIRGILSGLGADPALAMLTPSTDGCCVALRSATSAGGCP